MRRSSALGVRWISPLSTSCVVRRVMLGGLLAGRVAELGRIQGPVRAGVDHHQDVVFGIGQAVGPQHLVALVQAQLVQQLDQPQQQRRFAREGRMLARGHVQALLGGGKATHGRLGFLYICR
ncbi:hypothetical protein QE400_002224 [Xanthomonas sacchari]|uniref:hypothetical protein n=1 Tax=Xanthomonas sacchari TaxID=56458 RepID=UPI00277F93D8|nr:hypothetical protein [Xanthomonas sacchari]MDQ1092811.1 hypothetical protein [Xanthomonas sacchari]